MAPTQTPTPTMTPTSTSTPTATPTATPKPKPKAPVQECPKGRYIVRNLGFYWAPSENAESYLVEWWNNKGQKGSLTLSNSDVTCQNNRCIANATLPGVGHYAWTRINAVLPVRPCRVRVSMHGGSLRKMRPEPPAPGK